MNDLSTLLIKSIREDNYGAAARLLKVGADPNVALTDGLTAIHLAVGNDSALSLEFTRLLLGHGANPNVSCTLNGMTPLHVAASNGKLECLQLLLQNGGDPYLNDFEEENAISMATKFGEQSCVDLLRLFEDNDVQVLADDVPQYSWVELSSPRSSCGSNLSWLDGHSRSSTSRLSSRYSDCSSVGELDHALQGSRLDLESASSSKCSSEQSSPCTSTEPSPSDGREHKSLAEIFDHNVYTTRRLRRSARLSQAHNPLLSPLVEHLTDVLEGSMYEQKFGDLSRITEVSSTLEGQEAETHSSGIKSPCIVKESKDPKRGSILRPARLSVIGSESVGLKDTDDRTKRKSVEVNTRSRRSFYTERVQNYLNCYDRMQHIFDVTSPDHSQVLTRSEENGEDLNDTLVWDGVDMEEKDFANVDKEVNFKTLSTFAEKSELSSKKQQFTVYRSDTDVCDSPESDGGSVESYHTCDSRLSHGTVKTGGVVSLQHEHAGTVSSPSDILGFLSGLKLSNTPVKSRWAPPDISGKVLEPLFTSESETDDTSSTEGSHLSNCSVVEYLYTDDEGASFIEKHLKPEAPSGVCDLGSLGGNTEAESDVRDWKELSLVNKHDPDCSELCEETARRHGVTTVDMKSKVTVSMEKDSPRHDESGDRLAIPLEIMKMTNKDLRQSLVDLGDAPGPVTKLTRHVYEHRLVRLRQDPALARNVVSKTEILPELRAALNGGLDVSDSDLSMWEGDMCNLFHSPDPSRKWREGISKTSFDYLLLDPRVTKNLPSRARGMDQKEVFQTFIKSIFYIGKGKRSRPYQHFNEALEQMKHPKEKASTKVQQILDIWASGFGVISLHVFQNTIPVEAYTREACMIEALGLSRLTNQKRGDFYGVSSTWPMKKKRQMGIHLLKRAMGIFVLEGERQIRPADIGG